MEPISLSLGLIAPAFGIGKAVRGFYKGYRNAPEDVEKLAKQADAWESILTAAHRILQAAEESHGNVTKASGGSNAISKQYNLCMKLLHQLSDDLKMSADAAEKHSWERVKKAFRRKEIGQSMAELKNSCDQFSTAVFITLKEQDGKKIQDLQSSLNDIHSSVDEHHVRINQRDILQWITTECPWDTHYAHKEDFQEGTLDDVLNSDQYYEWQNGVLDDDGNAVAPATLWCHGPPGAGKSTLVYAIIERLRKFYGQDAIIVHAYSSYEKQGSQSMEKILACMVKIAVSQFAAVPDFVVDEWKNHNHGLSPIRLKTLHSLLCKLLGSRRKSFILIDALDEITSSQGSSARQLEPDDVLDEIFNIMKKVNGLKADQGQICCRALLTSRERCSANYSEFGVSEMPIKAAEADIRLTLEARIDDRYLRRLHDKIKKDANARKAIVEKITNDAQGVFLLATLQLQYLCQCTNLRNLYEALNGLPQDLQESHKRSMERIRNQPAQRRETALKALSLVYHAIGVLTVESAQQALAVRNGDIDFDKSGIDDEETLHYVTAGLLTTRSGYLVFAHHTVKEFFRKPQGNGRSDGYQHVGSHFPDRCSTAGQRTVEIFHNEALNFANNWFTGEQLAHGYVANQCLNFLVLKNFLEPLNDTQRELRAKEFPFLKYAVRNVGFHLHFATALEDEHYALTKRCLALLDKDAIPRGSLQEFLATVPIHLTPAQVHSLQLPKKHLALLCDFVGVFKNLVTAENVNSTSTTRNETILQFDARLDIPKLMDSVKKCNRDSLTFQVDHVINRATTRTIESWL